MITFKSVLNTWKTVKSHVCFWHLNYSIYIKEKEITYFIGITSYGKSRSLALFGRTLLLILCHLGPHKIYNHKVFNMARTGQSPLSRLQESAPLTSYTTSGHHVSIKRPSSPLQILHFIWKSVWSSGSSSHSASLMFTALCVWASAFISAGSDSHWPPLLPPLFFSEKEGQKR